LTSNQRKTPQAQNCKSDVKFLLKFGRRVHRLPSRTFGRILRPKFSVRRTSVHLYRTVVGVVPPEKWGTKQLLHLFVFLTTSRPNGECLLNET